MLLAPRVRVRATVSDLSFDFWETRRLSSLPRVAAPGDLFSVLPPEQVSLDSSLSARHWGEIFDRTPVYLGFFRPWSGDWST